MPFRSVLLPYVAQTKSFVIRRVASSDGALLVAKYPRRLTGSSRQALERQFRSLSELSFALDGALRSSVPRPIRHSDSMLLTTFVPGVNLRDILRVRANAVTGWANKQSLAAIGRNVGTWLRNFQAATKVGSVDDVFGAYRTQLEANARRCQARGVSDILLSKVLTHARSLIAVSQKGHTEVSASHGDFLPQNILIDGSKVGVVDFDNYSSVAPVCLDLATLLAYNSLLAAKREYSRHALTFFSKGLIMGYRHDVNLQLIKLFLFNAALRIMLDGSSSFTRRQCCILERVLSDALCNRIIGFPALDSSFRSSALAA
jgi:Ser/Thr protein kinase RdoA (MazF antagonist)